MKLSEWLRIALLAAPGLMLMGCATGTKTTAAPMPTIVSAADWGSYPDLIPEERRHAPSIITIHHEGDKPYTETSNPYVKLVNLQNWGKSDKNWPDLPYHYLIAPNGSIYQGRDVNYQPETNTNYDVSGHIGIMLYGNFEEQRVSPQQLASAVALSAWLCQKYGIDPDTIEGHKDAAPNQTDCPGRDFYRYLHAGPFNGWVKDTLAGKTPQITEFPPLPEGPTAPIPMGVYDKPTG